jgi:CRISPR-associated protein Cas1
VILMGPGTSITQKAARLLSTEKVLIAFVGGGATPIFMGSINEYSPTFHLINWIKFWHNPEARLAVAKYFNYARCDAIKKIWPTYRSPFEPDDITNDFIMNSERAENIDQLRGYEGEYAKRLYKRAALAVKLNWSGRQAGETNQDLANSFLDQGNYLAYGAAGTILYTLGIPPGLAVNHGATRAGGLVFDLADTIKDALILPIAFECAKEYKKSKEFRTRVIENFNDTKTLTNLFEIMQTAIEIGLKKLGT